MGLIVVTEEPYNAEAPLGALAPAVTPVADFYVRNNFRAPELKAGDWRLRIGGAVSAPLELDLEALQALEPVELRVTLECAGNGRRLVAPRPPGTAWGLGATGTAVFGGAALRDVLALARPGASGVECLFTGADEGEVEGGARVRFQRSLPLEMALGAGPMLAWAMNGEPLTRDHGHPVRLIVPGYYAVASVKWLVGIEVLEHAFRGHFQADRYVYREPGVAERPVTTMRVRALVTSHAEGSRVPAGEVTLGGRAWSGSGAIVAVMVSLDGGPWLEAAVEPARESAAATAWRCALQLAPGAHAVRVRASDAGGAVQPLAPVWNELGYGNNGVQTLRLEAVPE